MVFIARTIDRKTTGQAEELKNQKEEEKEGNQDSR
jgi:hypothetical protein